MGTTYFTNKCLYEALQGNVDVTSDSIKACLMTSGFSFDRNSHDVWSDVSGSELAAGNGYTQDTSTLTYSSITEDDVNNRIAVAFSTLSFTASGGSIGPTPGMVMYDDTHASNIILGYIDFGGEQTLTNGLTGKILTPTFYGSTPASASTGVFVSVRLLYAAFQGEVDLSSDSLKRCLMTTGFSFDRSSHKLWADISANELATGNGYTQDTATMAAVTLTEDDVDGRVEVTFASNPTWTASGGSIGPTPGMIVYDDTHASNILVVYFKAGSTEQTISSGETGGILTPTLLFTPTAP